MSYEPRIVCDAPECRNSTPAPHEVMAPLGSGWLRVVPADANEASRDFCSMYCLTEWAAQQTGRELSPSAHSDSCGCETERCDITCEAGKPIEVTTNLNGPQHWRPSDATVWPTGVAATACIPSQSGFDVTKPFGCWPR